MVDVHVDGMLMSEATGRTILGDAVVFAEKREIVDGGISKGKGGQPGLPRWKYAGAARWNYGNPPVGKEDEQSETKATSLTGKTAAKKDGKSKQTTDPMQGHPMQGKTKVQMVAHLTAKGYAGRDPDTGAAPTANPNGYDTKNYPKGVDGPKIIDAVKKTIVSVQVKNSFARPTIKDVYESVKGDNPKLTINDFHNVLAKAHADKEIRLDPFTQTKSTLQHPEYAMPLDLETKYYIDLPIKRQH